MMMKWYTSQHLLRLGARPCQLQLDRDEDGRLLEPASGHGSPHLHGRFSLTILCASLLPQ